MTQGLGRSWCAKGAWVEGRRSSSVAPSATGDFWVCVRRSWRERISLEQTKTKFNTGHWKDSGGWRCASDILCRHCIQCKEQAKTQTDLAGGPIETQGPAPCTNDETSKISHDYADGYCLTCLFPFYTCVVYQMLQASNLRSININTCKCASMSACDI